jgi:hypothetical protein
MQIAGKYVVQYLIIKLDSNDQFLPGEDLNISNLSLDRSDRNKSESPTGTCIRWMDLSERKSCDFVESHGTHFQWIDSRGEYSYRYSIVSLVDQVNACKTFGHRSYFHVTHTIKLCRIVEQGSLTNYELQ